MMTTYSITYSSTTSKYASIEIEVDTKENIDDEMLEVINYLLMKKQSLGILSVIEIERI